MSFLAPKILFWLFALPIPFIIHLWHLKTTRRVWFSSILLLKRAEQGEQSFKKLREILLLIIRTLSILFLVLAFANPVLNKKQKIVILDDSYDMLTKTISGKPVFDLARKETHKFRSAKIMLASGGKYTHNSAPKFRLFKLNTKNSDYIITRKGKLLEIKGRKIIEIERREDNFSIDSIDFQNAKLFAKITNHTDRPVEKLVSLYINSPQIETLSTRVYMPANSNTKTLFPLNAKYVGNMSGYLQIESDALDIDNVRYFVIPERVPLEVLVSGNANNTFFIKNALSPPGIDSKITVSEIEETSLTQLSPKKYDVFISSNKEALRFPNNIFAPVETDYNPSLQNNGFLKITNLVESHPIFSDPLIVKELKQMRFNRTVTPDENVLENAKILARFSNGSPAVVELENKNLWLGFRLNRESSDLVVSSIFVPLVYRMVYWIAGKPLQKYNFVSGEQVKLRAHKPGSYVCKTIAGPVSIKQSTLNAVMESDGIYLIKTAETPGLYMVEGVPAEKDTTLFAVNINNEFVSSSGSLSDVGQAYPAENRTPIRNWFLWLTLALLGLELVLRRR